jgi:hypothetical protein
MNTNIVDLDTLQNRYSAVNHAFDLLSPLLPMEPETLNCMVDATLSCYFDLTGDMLSPQLAADLVTREEDLALDSSDLTSSAA